jgi:16S rRNA G527 N7-methylase RsmG
MKNKCKYYKILYAIKYSNKINLVAIKKSNKVFSRNFFKKLVREIFFLIFFKNKSLDLAENNRVGVEFLRKILLELDFEF